MYALPEVSNLQERQARAVSNSSYDDGYAGNPIQADTNVELYNRGVKDREDAKPPWAKPKEVPVPGIAYTLIIVAPSSISSIPCLA